MQKTVVICKPDCVEKKLVGEVLGRFERAGFEIIGCKMMQLTPELMRVHYAHIMSKPVFPTLVEFMTWRPVVAVILRGENVIAKVRELLGPTHSKLAPKDTVRGDFGRDRTYNILHASDSPESAQIEIERFFKPEDVFDNVYKEISYANVD